jgi:hypothetical protein
VIMVKEKKEMHENNNLCAGYPNWKNMGCVD